MNCSLIDRRVIVLTSASKRIGVLSNGFTLIELMVTIGLVGVLMALAAPSMMRVLRSNRIQTAASSLVGDLQFARTEAVKRGQSVTICVSSDGLNCKNQNTWHLGWIVFFDKDGNGSVDAAGTDVVLRKRGALASGDTFVATPATNSVIFNREGFPSSLGAAAVSFQLRNSDPQATRCVVVNLGGRITVMPAGGPCT